MSVNKIASRYAKSLLDLAVEQNKLELILGDIKGFAAACENRDLELLLKSPIVKTDKKLSILNAIFGGKVDELTMAFLTIVAKKGREAALPQIADKFIAMYNTHSKITKVIITTAQPMGEVEFAKVKAKLAASNITEENLDIETKVDDSIIGGFVIEIGDKLYDASIAHKLEKLKKELSGNEYAATI